MRISHKWCCWLIVVSLLVVSGCGSSVGSRDQSYRDHMEAKQVEDHIDSQQVEISLKHHNRQSYVSLSELMDTVGFHTEWDEETSTFNIGDSDVLVQIQPESRQAMKDEEPVTLTSSPLWINDQLYISIQDIPLLFKDEFRYRANPDHFYLVTPDLQNDQLLNPETDSNISDDLNFEEDPSDPFEDEAVWLPDDAQPVLKNININNMIKTARRYLGVKYKFGAGPYNRTKRFDCSSYTQFIFKKYGVNLRRTARKQANQGKYVSRKSLRKGDLLFFYVPGRFKSNKTVGHVGIYIGNNRMIHASPKPKNGVQITNINKAFWKKTFIRAKRVAY